MTKSFQHDFPFDPTYGYDLPKLLTIAPPPAPVDFESFWRDLHARTTAVPVRVSKQQLDGHRAHRHTFEVEFDSLDGFRVGAWMTIPVDGKVARGCVVGHGYGGRDEPDYGPQFRHAAAIFPCGRGFNRSKRSDLPDRADLHVVHGIESRDTYIHGKCAADLWAAVSALRELVPGDYPIDYHGGSFGGGIGAMALPWDSRFHRAFFEVPSFGHHPLRLTMPCNGSGEAVRVYHQQHPEVAEVLRYFDSAIAATHVKIPTLVAPALFDTAVPPPGQFAVYNALAGTKKLFVRSAGHFTYPDETKEHAAMIREITKWLDASVV